MNIAPEPYWRALAVIGGLSATSARKRLAFSFTAHYSGNEPPEQAKTRQ